MVVDVGEEEKKWSQTVRSPNSVLINR